MVVIQRCRKSFTFRTCLKNNYFTTYVKILINQVKASRTTQKQKRTKHSAVTRAITLHVVKTEPNGLQLKHVDTVALQTLIVFHNARKSYTTLVFVECEFLTYRCIKYFSDNDITTKAIRRGCQISNTTKSDLNGSNCSTTLFGSQIVTILSCDVCTSDMCNSSPNYAAGLYSLVLPIFGYLVFDFTN